MATTAVVAGGLAVVALVAVIIGGVTIAGSSSSSGSSSTLPSVNIDTSDFDTYDQFGNVITGTGTGSASQSGSSSSSVGLQKDPSPSIPEYDSSGNLIEKDVTVSIGTTDTRPSVTISSENTRIEYYTSTGEWQRTEVYNPSGVLVETIYPAKTEEESGTITGTETQPSPPNNNKNKKKTGCQDLDLYLFLPPLAIALVALWVVGTDKIAEKQSKKKGAKK